MNIRTRNILLVIVLSVLVIIASAFIITSFKEITKDNFAHAYSGGDGSVDDPYVISSKADLEAFRDAVNGGSTTLCAVLETDITLDNTWSPIGEYPNLYTGTFDGQGFTITYNVTGVTSVFSLFNYVDAGAKIKNLQTAGSIVASNYAAGIACTLRNGGTIETCINRANITGSGSGYYYYGGIVALSIKGVVSQCANEGNISAPNYCGGISGDSRAGTVQNCYNVGNITTTGENCGGIDGNAEFYSGKSFITNCFSTASIGTSSENKRGALVGYLYASEMRNSYYMYGDACGDQGGSAVMDQVELLTAEEFKTQSSFNTWDFTNIWRIKAGDDYPTLRGLTFHKHELTYTANGATITATCSAEECALPNNQATLTLNAPLNLNWNGDAKSATITAGYDESAFPKAKVIYKKDNVEILPENVVLPGDYVALVEFGTVAAEVSFTIQANFDSFVWSADNTTAQAKFVSPEDATLFKYEDAQISNQVLAQVTCEENGITRYIATYEDYSDYRDVQNDALGHNYEFDGFEWSANYLTAKAISICLNDASHKKEVDVDVVVTTIKEATSSEAGIKRYAVTYDSHSEYKEVEIPMKKSEIEDNGVKAKIDGDALFDGDINLKVEIKTDVKAKESKTDYAKIQAKLDKKESIVSVYDVKLIRTINGIEEEIQPEDMKEGTVLVVRMKMPKGIEAGSFRLLHIHSVDDIELIENYTIEGDEIVLNTNRFSEFAFAVVKDGLPLWLIILIVIGCLLVVGIIICLMLFLLKKKKESTKEEQPKVEQKIEETVKDESIKNDNAVKNAEAEAQEVLETEKTNTIEEIESKQKAHEALTLKDSLTLAKATTSSHTFTKKYVANYLRTKDIVEVNERENFTKTGLPLADTHYVDGKDGKKCFAYVYETEGSIILLAKMDETYAKQLQEKHTQINKSAFPKQKNAWYSLIIDDTYTKQEFEDILDELIGEVKEDAGVSLKESIALAKANASIQKFTKAYVCEYLKGRSDVELNTRENFTKTGLPLADTHYVEKDGKKVCFAYVYEIDGTMILLAKMNTKYANELKKKHSQVNLSAFPKQKDTWYSLIIDDSYSKEEFERIIDDISK